MDGLARRTEPAAALTPDDERCLWQQWHLQRAPLARHRLLQHHLPYARIVAASYYRRRLHDEIEFGDYLQFATVGMLEAMERFDPQAGAQFKTFAARRMHGAIVDGLASMTEKQRQIAVRQRLRADRSVSLAGQDGMPTRGSRSGPAAWQGEVLFQQLAAVGVGLALGILLEGTGMIDGATEAVAPGRGAEGYRRCELRELRQRLLEALGTLTAQARQVIRSHYLQEMPFDEIAGSMGLTKGRISQIHREALALLHQRLEGGEPLDLTC